MSSFALRLIALITMLIDHLGAAFFRRALTLRAIGRLSFPLYCFLLAEGYVHTRNAGRYALRLALLALLSEIPFDLLFFGRPFSWLGQNVFFTLLIALIAIYCWAKLAKAHLWLAGLCVIALCALSMVIRADYALFGVLFPLGFYIFHGDFRKQALCFAVLDGCYLVFLSATGMPLYWIGLQTLSLAALIPIALYNGKRGFAKLQWLFYAAYPLHLLLFWLLRLLRVVPPFLLG